MLVPQQVQVDIDVTIEDKDDVEPTSPTPAITPPPPQQVIIPLPSQVESTPPPSPYKSHIAPPSSPPPQQPPSHEAAISMDLLNQFLETCTTLTKKVGGGIAEMDADEDVTLEEVVDEVVKDADVQGRLEEFQAQVYHLDLEHADKVLSMHDEAEPAELTEVVTAATTTAAPMPTASAARKRKGVVIRDPEETATPSVIVHYESKSKDKGKWILVEEPKPLKKQAQTEQDEAYARKLEAELNPSINWNEVIEQVKRKENLDNTVMRYQSLKKKPQAKAQARKNMMHFNSIVAFLEKGEKELKEEASKQSKRKSKTSKEKAAKKQKLDEEVEELKTHLQIVPNDEDDVYTEATPLALKMILLVERRYPLIRFTLEQMLNNVRLEVEEKSEVSLELLRFVRRQQQEGYRPE
nr:hypothetical protein [Tanacetum cinerariifolium]